MANLFDSLLRSVGNLLKENTESDTGSQEEHVDMVQRKEQLTRDIVRALSELLKEVSSTEHKCLVVWLDVDKLHFDNYNTESSRLHIQESLMSECGIVVEYIQMKNATPDEQEHATPIGASGKVFIQLLSTQKPQGHVATQALIRISDGQGSLLEESYVLSPEDMHRRGITAYNIGAGKKPHVSVGYRENHIAIDDDPNSPMVEKNKYVSRMHAHIGYSESIGFYLQVEMDGSRLMGKRTRIFRGMDMIECENPNAKEPLMNGDRIELGKAVILLVEINK